MTTTKSKIIFLSGLVLIAFISFINMFPEGYVFSGNDVAQFINLKNTFGNLLYTWNPIAGTGAFLQYFSYSLFYLPFYFFSALGLSPSAQSFLYFFIFLGSSYVSFFVSSKVFAGNRHNQTFELRFLLSLIYAINPYTLYVFTYIWGYSPFLFLYPLIPIIFSSTYSYFTSSSIFNKNLISLGIVFFLSNIAFGNFAFFVSLLLFLIIFVVLLWLLGLNGNRMLWKTIIYACLFFVASFWTTVPSVIGLMSSYSKMMGSESLFGLGNWILYQRLSILPQFFLFPNIGYLIENFSFIFVVGALGFFLLLLISLKNVRKLSLIFLLLTLVSVFITSKGKGLLSDEVTLKIFTLPVLNTLRSYDKTFVFLPFFFIIIIYIGLHNSYFKKRAGFQLTGSYLKLCRLTHLHLRKIVLISFIFVLLGVYPFFVGGIQTRYSFAIHNGENYQTSSSTYLVRIPNDYFDAAKILSQDVKQNRILHLPYSVINSIGWVNFPKWGVVSVDPTEQLFSKPSIQANSAGSPFWKEWNSANVNSSPWMIKLMSLYNVQYLIYHKDVDDKFINQTRDKIDFLREEGYITLISNYDNFELYNLSDMYFRPHIYPTSNLVLVNGSSDEMLSSIISNNLTTSKVFFPSLQATKEQWQLLVNYNENYGNNEKTSEAMPQIVFKEINPTRYHVRIENATHPFFLVFSESYNPEWKAYIDNSGTEFGNIIANYDNVGVKEAGSAISFTLGDIRYLFEKSLPDSDHYVVNGYANAWYINPTGIAKDQNGNFEITLFFKPQSLFYLGLVFSAVTFVTCVIYVIAQTVLFRSIYYSLKGRITHN